MSDMKCTRCNSDLEQIGDFYTCTNPHCTLCGDKDMWQELIRTRKALEIAVDAIKNATEYLSNQEPLVDVMAMNLYIDLSKALEQITTEQKEVK